MNFYAVHHSADGAATDVLFPTKAERERYIRETYEKDDDAVVRRTITMKGRLNKAMVCRVYELAQR